MMKLIRPLMRMPPVHRHGTGFLCRRQRGVSGADHDAHRHVEHVTLGGEFLELLQHGRTSV